MSKYDGDEFQDPILRCDACNKLVHRKWIAHHAGCNHCGNRRFRNVRGMNEAEELNPLRAGTYDLGLADYEIDPEWFDLFEPARAI